MFNRTYGKPGHLQHALQYNATAEVDEQTARAGVLLELVSFETGFGL